MVSEIVSNYLPAFHILYEMMLSTNVDVAKNPFYEVRTEFNVLSAIKRR